MSLHVECGIGCGNLTDFVRITSQTQYSSLYQQSTNAEYKTVDVFGNKMEWLLASTVIAQKGAFII